MQWLKSTDIEMQSIVICTSVCLLEYVKNHTTKFYPIFSTCYLWP